MKTRIYAAPAIKVLMSVFVRVQTLVPLVMHLDDEESILGEGEQREALHHAIWWVSS